ncbi:MAG: hypothetical protein ABII68_00020 [Pseudomonadota bacterium]
MNLLQHIRSDRKEKKKKEPYKQTLFNRIGAIVKSYKPADDFLEKLENFRYELSGGDVEFDRIKLKPRLEIPLFSLLTRDEYRVTKKIMNSVESPYIHFANSLDEILLSRSLFLRNPSLSPETLARHHLETLLLCEFAKEKIRDLKQRPAEVPEKRIEVSPVEPTRADPAPVRIEMLEAFVNGIEKNRTQL